MPFNTTEYLNKSLEFRDVYNPMRIDWPVDLRSTQVIRRNRFAKYTMRPSDCLPFFLAEEGSDCDK